MALVNRCWFRASSGGTSAFTVSSAITGFLTPANAGAVNGAYYPYAAESDDLTEWEVGVGVYTSSGTTLSRIVLKSSNANAAVNFTAAPKVALTALADDLSPTPQKGYLYGLTLSNNASDATNDIDITTGEATDSTGAVVMKLTSALTKRLDAGWAAGTGNGMRNSGASIANGTYHIYLVAKAGGADVDIYAHASAVVGTVLTALQAETGGSAYIYARRIASIMRVSGVIAGFVQHGDSFRLKDPILDHAATNPGTSAVSRSLSVPTGINVIAQMNVQLAVSSADGVNSGLYLSDLDQTDMVPSLTAAPLQTVAGFLMLSTSINSWSGGVRTNTSGLIRSRLTGSAANTILRIATIGWDDHRGRMF
jgi:hypothetical protein